MSLQFQEKHLFLCRLPKTLRAQDLSKLRIDTDSRRGRWSSIYVPNVNGRIIRNCRCYYSHSDD